jgi:hypothetical protein
MKIHFTLLTENAVAETIELNIFIQEHNLKGVITKVAEDEPTHGDMNMTDYLPVIEMVLSSSVVAAGAAGLFSVIKSHFENRAAERIAKINADKDIKIQELQTQKELAIVNRQEDTKQDLFEMTMEIDGNKMTLKASEANYQEALAALQQQLLETPKKND